MVRNEQDTIGPVVDHLAEQGVDAFIIADNGSSDATPDVLADLARRHRLYVVRDSLTAYLQGTKMTMLAELAGRSGADWIVPFDADELWFARDSSVADLLRTTSADVVHAELHNVFPTHQDPRDPNPFKRITQFDTSPSSMGKVAVRWHPMMTIWTGNHGATRTGLQSGGLFVAHYPWRSIEQLTAKLLGGSAAMRNVADQSLVTHWRRGGLMTPDEVESAWEELLCGRPVETLAWSPIGPLEYRVVSEWKTWMDRGHTT
jgi:hypothetical protein